MAMAGREVIAQGHSLKAFKASSPCRLRRSKHFVRDLLSDEKMAGFLAEEC